MAAVKPAPQYSQGLATAEGIFAEIDTVLSRHNQKTALKITLPLQEKIQDLLPALGIRLDEAQLRVIVPEIAAETTRQFFEDAAKIQTPKQINDIVADSLAQTIITHPQIAPQLKVDETKILEKAFKQTAEVARQNQTDLEKAAVLANLQKVAGLETNTQNVKELISQVVEGSIETGPAPLTPPEQREALKPHLETYLGKCISKIF